MMGRFVWILRDYILVKFKQSVGVDFEKERNFNLWPYISYLLPPYFDF